MAEVKVMAEEVTEFGESFANGIQYWVVGVGRGILISAVPILLIALGLSIIIALFRFPLEYIGGFK
tara:strand:- start:179 stop:376 length:198 start_codon:yes stop_codon:yes gene_type:complete